MRRLALLVAGLAILAIAVATTAGAEDPPGSEFIDPTNARAESFAIPSTDGWEVKGTAVDGTKPARVVRVDRKPTPTSSDPLTRQGLAVLWAKKCTVEKQRLVFKRNVYLAGPEYKLGAAIDFAAGSGSRGFKSGRILVNGREVLEVDGSGGRLDRPERSKAFLFGNNTVEVIVVKRPNHSNRRCNTAGTAPHRRTGVRWNIFGEFATDVGLPPQEREEYFRLPEDALFSVNLPLDFTLRNKGPGGIARMPLHISFDAPVTGEPHGTIVRVPRPANPVQSCEIFPPGNAQGYTTEQKRTVVCQIANLRSGESVTQRVNFAFTPVAGSGKTPVYLRWSAFYDEPAGADFTDNERAKTIWICKHDDPDERCK
jgi:hypothetical protein